MATSPLTDFGFTSPPPPETTAEKLAELVRLQKFAQRITSTLDIEELVPRIVDEVAASLGCVEINLFLRDPEKPEFVLAGVRGCTVHGKGHRLSIGEGMVGHVAATRKMHYAPDVTQDPYYMACEPRYALRSRHPAATRGRSGRSFHRFPLRAQRFLPRSAALAARLVRPCRRRGT